MERLGRDFARRNGRMIRGMNRREKRKSRLKRKLLLNGKEGLPEGDKADGGKNGVTVVGQA